MKHVLVAPAGHDPASRRGGLRLEEGVDAQERLQPVRAQAREVATLL